MEIPQMVNALTKKRSWFPSRNSSIFLSRSQRWVSLRAIFATREHREFSSAAGARIEILAIAAIYLAIFPVSQYHVCAHCLLLLLSVLTIAGTETQQGGT